jgi:alcohol dehydrogenase (cytochrome c)
VNWLDGFDANGRPKRVLEPSAAGTLVYPNNQGATNWYSPSYSPRTGLFYIPSWTDTSSVYRKDPGNPPIYTEGAQFNGIFPTVAFGTDSLPAMAATPTNTRLTPGTAGAVQAFDPRTGERKWSFAMNDVTDAGVLTTSTNVLFSGGREGYFYALDARDGKLLWKTQLGGSIANGPISYLANGRQYVTVAAGNAMFVFALRQ